jgi:protein TonB
MNRLVVRLIAVACVALSVASAATPTPRDVELTFDRNKGQIYALYGRALKEHPGLKGRLDIEISIASSGETTDCRVTSSQLGAPELERKICEKVKTWRFAPRPASIKVTKPIEFFPAA